MQIINVAEAKAQLSALINAALAGEEVIIAKAGEPAVRLTPVRQPSAQPRVGGQMRGKIWMAPDFDEFTKEDEELWYNGPIFPEENNPDDNK